MSIGSVSLLTFLDAPVVVGDPDGRTAYVNPAFAARFRGPGDDATGQPLSALFEGGAGQQVGGDHISLPATAVYSDLDHKLVQYAFNLITTNAECRYCY